MPLSQSRMPRYPIRRWQGRSPRPLVAGRACFPRQLHNIPRHSPLLISLKGRQQHRRVKNPTSPKTNCKPSSPLEGQAINPKNIYQGSGKPVDMPSTIAAGRSRRTGVIREGITQDLVAARICGADLRPSPAEPAARVPHPRWCGADRVCFWKTVAFEGRQNGHAAAFAKSPANGLDGVLPFSTAHGSNFPTAPPSMPVSILNYSR